MIVLLSVLEAPEQVPCRWGFKAASGVPSNDPRHRRESDGKPPFVVIAKNSFTQFSSHYINPMKFVG
jgi:hypothetical protein